jgi:hypothetical protein
MQKPLASVYLVIHITTGVSDVSMSSGRKKEDHCSLLRKNRAIYMEMENAHYVDIWETD